MLDNAKKLVDEAKTKFVDIEALFFAKELIVEEKTAKNFTSKANKCD